MHRRPLALVLLLAALAATLGLVGAGGPAQAATTLTIVISPDGATPARTAATAGDRVQFKNTSTSSSFAVNGQGFTTGLIGPGKTSATTAALAVGSYGYAVQLGGLVPTGGGTVVVTAPGTPTPTTPPTTTPPAVVLPGAPATTAPAPGPTTAPGSPVTSLPPGATAAPGVPAPVNTGGSGVALQPRLDTGSLLLPGDPQALTDGGLAPQLAPDQLAELPPVTAEGFGGTQLGGPLDAGSLRDPQAGALTERLNDPASLRRYGLPAVVGIVLMLGAASLVVRVLLATTSLRAWLHGRSAFARTA